jgi:hypothetical protein
LLFEVGVDFFWLAFGAGKLGCDDGWMTEILILIEFAPLAAQRLLIASSARVVILL